MVPVNSLVKLINSGDEFVNISNKGVRPVVDIVLQKETSVGSNVFENVIGLKTSWSEQIAISEIQPKLHENGAFVDLYLIPNDRILTPSGENTRYLLTVGSMGFQKPFVVPYSSSNDGGGSGSISLEAALNETLVSPPTISASKETELDTFKTEMTANSVSANQINTTQKAINDKNINITNSLVYKGEIPTSQNLDTYIEGGIYAQSQDAEATVALNYPIEFAGILEVLTNDANSMVYQRYHKYNSSDVYIRSFYGSWTPWKKVIIENDNVSFGTGDFTGNLKVGMPEIGSDGFWVAPDGTTRIYRNSTSPVYQVVFYDMNGLVGSIISNNGATSFNTNSDPRLKTEFEDITDIETWENIEKLMECLGWFYFKSDLETRVLGFDAHKLVNRGFDMGTEGVGPRDANIGDIIEPAEYETVEIQPAIIDEETGEEIQPAITDKQKIKEEVRVTPAGVDQSKGVPYLLPAVWDLKKVQNELTGTIEELAKQLSDQKSEFEKRIKSIEEAIL